MMSKLLLVEDDQSIVSSLSDYLGNEGFKIENADKIQLLSTKPYKEGLTLYVSPISIPILFGWSILIPVSVFVY